MYLVGSEPIGEPFLHIQDCRSDQLWPFGKSQYWEDDTLENRMDWIWRQNGQLKVIRTPHWLGRHVASAPAEFLAVIKELQDLHAQGYVHGDIRCFNIMFNGDHGKFIDFDHSGKVGETIYPQGYSFAVNDGTRKDERKTMEMDEVLPVPRWHDWFALGNVILSSHGIKPPIGGNEGEFSAILARIYLLQGKLGELTSDDDAVTFVADLVALLKKCEDGGWACFPRASLASAVKEARYGSMPKGAPHRRAEEPKE
jgi:hypothetical protein